MSKHAIYIIPICIILAYLWYNKVESLQEGVNEEQFDKECLAELKRKLNDSVVVVDIEDRSTDIDGSAIDGGFSLSNASYEAVNRSGFLILSDRGDTLLFESLQRREDTDTAWINYTYYGYEEKSKMHWISKETYKGSNNLLISQSTGNIYNLLGFPQYNPDRTRIFSKQHSTFWMHDAGYPGFQIWKNNNGILALQYDIKLNGYYIVNGKWKSNHQLLLELGPATQYMSNVNGHKQQVELIFPQE